MIQFTSNLAAVSADLERVAKLRLFAAAQHYRTAMLTTLSGSRGGKQYPVPGTRRTYTASAPGEAPAVLFGDLRRSVRVGSPEVTPNGIKISVGSDLQKAAWLEFGTSEMRPRPAWKPTMQAEQSALKAIVEARWF